MRLTGLLTLLGLALATDLAYRPWLYAGLATPDPPLLFLLWLAHLDRRGRVYVAVGVLVLLRTLFSGAGVVEIALPLIVAVELMLWTRKFLHVRDRAVRFVPLFLAAMAAVATMSILEGPTWDARFVADLGRGGVYAILSAGFLFPILDSLKPLIRSYSHPL